VLGGGEIGELVRPPDAASLCSGYRLTIRQEQGLFYLCLIHHEFHGQHSWSLYAHAQVGHAIEAGEIVANVVAAVAVAVSVAVAVWGHMCVAFVVAGFHETFDYRIDMYVHHVVAYGFLLLVDVYWYYY